uniref:Uncharacterized protein n=1 Tax=Triticum urartu TaxID=4572 RepID=A0A8R7U9Z5_TRIUA
MLCKIGSRSPRTLVFYSKSYQKEALFSMKEKHPCLSAYTVADIM